MIHLTFYGELLLCPCQHDFVSPDPFHQGLLMGQQACPPDDRRKLAFRDGLYDLSFDERGCNVP